MDINLIPNLTTSDLEPYMDGLYPESDSSFRQFKLSPLPTEEVVVDTNEVPLQQIVDTTSPQDTPQISPMMSPTGTIPCQDDFPGPLAFEILLDGATAHKKSWVYSHKLNKVYIDIEKTLLVQFRVKEFFSGLRVRALPVYSSADYVSEPVQRCTLHELNIDKMQKAHQGALCFCSDYKWVRHVVQSTHSQAQYDYDAGSNRHSVVVPLEAPQAGADVVTVGYHFTCKTSCTLGMSRKPIIVIFTLETDQCQVVGRQILGVKVCSCPKRDKEKEEIEVATRKLPCPLGKRRMSAADRLEATKKVKTEISPAVTNEETKSESTGNPNYEELQGKISHLESQVAFQAFQLQELRKEIEDFRKENSEHLKTLNIKMDNLFQLFNCTVVDPVIPT